MDIQSKSSSSKSFSARVKKSYEHFEAIKAEFRKVEWTDEQNVWVYVQAVIITTFVFGIGIYLTDVIVQQTLQGLQNIMTWFFG